MGFELRLSLVSIATSLLTLPMSMMGAIKRQFWEQRFSQRVSQQKKVKDFLKQSMEYLNFDREVIENAIELANEKKSQMLIDS